MRIVAVFVATPVITWLAFRIFYRPPDVGPATKPYWVVVWLFWTSVCWFVEFVVAGGLYLDRGQRAAKQAAADR